MISVMMNCSALVRRAVWRGVVDPLAIPAKMITSFVMERKSVMKKTMSV
jgi:hypothetical protein